LKERKDIMKLKLYGYSSRKYVFWKNNKYHVIFWGGKTYFKTHKYTIEGEIKDEWFVIKNEKKGGILSDD
jgi:hypothetical protein